MLTPFRFDFDVEVFQKSGEDAAKERRIAGFVTTDKLDQQGERLIQEGLDFRPFLSKGWFNDNHSKDTTGIVGYPESAVLVERGSVLPNGQVATKKGWYVEGYLLKGTKRSDEIWELANALQKSARRLGFSVEGAIQKREIRGGAPHVAAAVVRNVAITNCPVNDDTALEVIAKSLDALDKAMAAGTSFTHGVPVVGGGAVVMPESIEGAPRPKKRKKKGLSKSAGVAFIRARWPHVSAATAEQVYALAAKKRSA